MIFLYQLTYLYVLMYPASFVLLHLFYDAFLMMLGILFYLL